MHSSGLLKPRIIDVQSLSPVHAKVVMEPFERGWFGGIVGWCDSQGNGEWVVTIRCGEVRHQQITLFAGAGIVPGSQPESEWHETGVKLSTMLHALGIAPQQDFA